MRSRSTNSMLRKAARASTGIEILALEPRALFSVTGLTPPSALAAVAQSRTSVQLNWTDNDSSAQGYYVLRSSNGVQFNQLAKIATGTAAAYVDGSAHSGTNYFYEVEAFSSLISAASNVAWVTTPLAAPSSLAIGVQSSTSEKLTWKNNDNSATGYYVLRSTDGLNFAPLAVLTGGGTNNYIDASALPGPVYTYEVEAYDATTVSPASNAAALGVMGAPSALAAAWQSNTSAKLTWKDSDSSAKGYYVLRSIDGADFSQLATLTSAGANSYTDTTVNSSHSYSYEVQAFDSQRTSVVSNTASVGPLAAPSALGVVQGLSTVTLSWQDNDPSASGYYVLRSTDGGSFSQLAKIGSSTAATYTDSTIAGGSTYTYEVEAFNSVLTSAASNPTSVSTPAAAPSGLSATASGAWVNLSWTGADASAAGFLVLRSADGVSFSQIAQLGSVTTSSYADTSVAASTTYSYQVQAYFSDGSTSPASNVATVTTASVSVAVTGNVTVDTRYGSELVITASGPDDSIALAQSGSTLSILADGQSYTVDVPADGVFVYTRGGSDSISVGASVAVQTTLETIDGAVTAISSAGTNVIAWTDSTDTFSGTGIVRRVSAFAGNVSKAAGASLPNPSDAGSTAASNLSLFGAGPVASDVNQGDNGDCYFMASLAAFAGEKPAMLTASAVDMGDGTYVVDFKNTYVRVSNQFSVGGFAGYQFAHPGPNGTIWAAAMEKAFCYFRTGSNTYASIWTGSMSEVYYDFGFTSSAVYPGSYSQSAFYSMMANDLSAGEAVTFGTYGSAPNLIGGHAYTLISVYTDASGNTHYVVRNPWGDPGDAMEDGGGYATLTFAQMVANFSVGFQAIG